MKIPKLLFLGVLVSALCITGSAFGAVSLDDSIGPLLQTYQIGETIEFVLCIAVQPGDANLVDLDVYFFPPGSPPSADACDDPVGEGIFIGHVDLLEAGDEVCFDSGDNAVLAHLVTAADCSEPLDVIAHMATTFWIQGAPGLGEQCDEKATINFVEPIDPPVCDISGPEVICEGAEDVEYSTSAIADTYSWSVTGDATISGPTNGTSVLVTPTSSAGFTVELEVCNDNGADGCCSTCELPVEVVEAPDCTISGPDSICEDDTLVEFCGPADADTWYWTISGDGEIVGDNDGQCVDVNPTGTGSFTLTLAVCYTDPLCCDGCEKIVDVVPNPNCEIDGQTSVCEGATGIQYCAPAGADSYDWGISGNGTIVGATDGQCVTVDAGAEGTFTLTLIVCNESDTGDCCSRCELEVTVESCGLFCSFTQGFWGNAGGKACNGRTTTELLVDLLDAPNASTAGADPVVVGVLGVKSITFDTADCILLRLPAGGKPSELPAFGDKNCASLPNSIVKKNNPTINNVLVGQVVTLTLNLRLNGIDLECDPEVGDLSGWVLPEEFCTIGEDGCPEHYTIPESLVGDTVADLLLAANQMLAGTYVGPASIGDIYNGVTAINEGFDECRETISCPTEEICDNGCDDDFDGLVDGDDIVDCPPIILP